ncbi:hypothetical protein HDU80_006144 [Chytriomyces hyalinus]|nr:hypothetical protein HDU80_006144 [Chytriomyces hyalinus]
MALLRSISHLRRPASARLFSVSRDRFSKLTLAFLSSLHALTIGAKSMDSPVFRITIHLYPESSNSIRRKNIAMPESRIHAKMKVSVQDLSASLAEGPKNTFHLFDIRETYEWNQGRIPNGFYTGRGNLERDIETYVPDTHDGIVLYCAGGVRSILAGESLKRMGYKNVCSLAGGIGAWKSAGKAVDAPGGKTFSEKQEY